MELGHMSRVKSQLYRTMCATLVYDLRENQHCGIGGLDLFMEDLKRGRKPSSFCRAARNPPPRAVLCNLHKSASFFFKTLLHLPIDIIPLLWYNISVIKERGNTYYD